MQNIIRKTGVEGPDFEKLITLSFPDGSVEVDSAARAVAILEERFPQPPGPSHLRARAACEAVLANTGPLEAAQATFIVAAMEAGLPHFFQQNYFFIK